MNIINFSNCTDIVPIGGSQDQLCDFLYLIKDFISDCGKQDCQNKCYIVTGNSHIGYDIAATKDFLKSMNNLLTKYKSVLLFMRGKDDKNEIFAEQNLGCDHIYAIRDYTLVKTQKYNVLCIGGGFSFDRKWKIQWQEMINRHKDDNNKKIFYNPNESIDINMQHLEDIKNCEEKIDGLITHTYIHLACQNVNEWLVNDDETKHDIDKETKFLSDLVNILTEKGSFKFWYGNDAQFNNMEWNGSNILLYQGSRGHTPFTLNRFFEEKMNEKLEKEKSVASTKLHFPFRASISDILYTYDLETVPHLGIDLG